TGLRREPAMATFGDLDAARHGAKVRTLRPLDPHATGSGVDANVASLSFDLDAARDGADVQVRPDGTKDLNGRGECADSDFVAADLCLAGVANALENGDIGAVFAAHPHL